MSKQQAYPIEWGTGEELKINIMNNKMKTLKVTPPTSDKDERYTIERINCKGDDADDNTECDQIHTYKKDESIKLRKQCWGDDGDEKACEYVPYLTGGKRRKSSRRQTRRQKQRKTKSYRMKGGRRKRSRRRR